MRTGRSLRLLSSLALTFLGIPLMGRAPTGPTVEGASPDCAMGEAVAGPEGLRRLALVVGIAHYKAPSVPDLAGPPDGARRFVELLSGPRAERLPSSGRRGHAPMPSQAISQSGER